MSPTFMPHIAAYDNELGVPYCAVTARGCSTGNLVKGRGTMTNGNELNCPNTLDGCGDGNFGKYLQYELLERIKIESMSGDYMMEGSLVKIMATAFVFDVNDNHVEIFYTAQHRSSGLAVYWKCHNYGNRTSRAIRVLCLPSGGSTIQAVCVNFCAFNDIPPLNACSGEGLDNRDDLALTVFRLPTPLPSAAPSTNPTSTMLPSAAPSAAPSTPVSNPPTNASGSTSAKRIRLSSTTGEMLQMFEFQVISSGANVAVNGVASHHQRSTI
jgi:hypothetical protein